ncbi:hypothetical protein IEQ34_006075 [Dendrobium chrysotoxum]|uniref:Uncharacterized protein n=1 Tax=Dendrobium chrysotoxum TaxID=161865 RepID=A0AAV7HAP6_DENCH|nr:hypothetical protein IEQ34_006075 [Dendrobium chrysotoxum]
MSLYVGMVRGILVNGLKMACAMAHGAAHLRHQLHGTAHKFKLAHAICTAPHSAALMAIVLANGGGKPPDWQDFVSIVVLLITNSTISFIEENNAVFRGLHATGVKKMGAHGHDEPFYVHAKHMYNLDRMKHQKLKVSLGVLAAFSIGVGVPVYAVIFQQRKTASG